MGLTVGDQVETDDPKPFSGINFDLSHSFDVATRGRSYLGGHFETDSAWIGVQRTIGITRLVLVWYLAYPRYIATT